MLLAASSANELLDLFTRYNHDLWPVHVAAYAVAVVPAAVLIAGRRSPRNDRLIILVLAALWLWLGIVFQGLYVTDVDPGLGVIYASAFVLEAALLLRNAATSDALAFRAWNGYAGMLGWGALGYSIVVYPILGAVWGHGWPESPLLGMAPCPTTIATFGLLLLARPPVPRHLMWIPLVWALVAPPAAMSRGVYEDLGLLLVGVGATAVFLVRDHRTHLKPHRPSIAV